MYATGPYDVCLPTILKVSEKRRMHNTIQYAVVVLVHVLLFNLRSYLFVREN